MTIKTPRQLLLMTIQQQQLKNMTTPLSPASFSPTSIKNPSSCTATVPSRIIYDTVVANDLEHLASLLQEANRTGKLSVGLKKNAEQEALRFRESLIQLEEAQQEHHAVFGVTTDVIQEALHFRDEETGATPLHKAAVTTDACGPAMVKLLLDAGADVSARDDCGRTPLLCAIQREDTSAKVLRCRRLLEYGADVNAADDDGVTPLLAAWENFFVGTTESHIFFLLLDHGANPNLRWIRRKKANTDDDQNTLLHWAVKTENIDNRRLVNKLLQNGADANATNSLGKTPLHYAVGKVGCGLSITMVLLQIGKADPCATDEEGVTPLIELCKSPHSHTTNRIDLLLDYVPSINDLHKSYLNARDKHGRSALLYACREGYKANLVRRLLELGADPLVRDNIGWTALMFACKNATVPAWLAPVETLLEAGVDPNLTDYGSGTTALHQAASQTAVDVNVISMLLSNGADPYKTDGSDDMPFVMACANGDADKAFVLLQAMVGQGVSFSLATWPASEPSRQVKSLPKTTPTKWEYNICQIPRGPYGRPSEFHAHLR